MKNISLKYFYITRAHFPWTTNAAHLSHPLTLNRYRWCKPSWNIYSSYKTILLSMLYSPTDFYFHKSFKVLIYFNNLISLWHFPFHPHLRSDIYHLNLLYVVCALFNMYIFHFGILDKVLGIRHLTIWHTDKVLFQGRVSRFYLQRQCMFT